jgi:hypothetical protein
MVLTDNLTPEPTHRYQRSCGCLPIRGRSFTQGARGLTARNIPRTASVYSLAVLSSVASPSEERLFSP